MRIAKLLIRYSAIFSQGAFVLILVCSNSVVNAQSHTYDTFDRLTAAALNDSTTLLYGYDALGNRTSYVLNPTDAFVPVKVLLEGPYEASTGLQTDALRQNSELPLTEPYSAAGYTELVNANAQISNPGQLLAQTGNAAITDWILVELREALDSTTVVARKAVLLQRDGWIVDTDGTGPVRLEGVPPGDYFVVIRHRNHLPIRSLLPYAVNRNTTNIDFTAGQNAYGQAPQAVINSVYAMRSGDANQDGSINAVDLNSAWRIQNGQPFNYTTSNADFNLDGTVNAVDLNLYWRVNNGRVAQGVD